MDNDIRHSLESCYTCGRDDLEVGEVRRTGENWWVCAACAAKRQWVRDGDEIRLKNGREGYVSDVDGDTVWVLLDPLEGSILRQLVSVRCADVEVLR